MKNKTINYLGIDWGEKRIGLALGDSEIKIASPFKVVGNIDDIIKVVKKEDIDMIVLGKPLKMSNVDFRLSNDYLDFFESLKKKVNIPIETIDERLSSKAADALVSDHPTPRLRRASASRDATAAMLILQTYLDKK